MSDTQNFWYFQRILKVISFLILAYTALTLAAFPVTLMINGPNNVETALIVVASAIPAIIVFVASYRQLFRQRPGLVSIACGVAVLTFLVMALVTIYTNDKIQSTYQLYATPENSEALRSVFPQISVKEAVKDFAFLTMLLAIPLYTNFRKL